MINDFGEAIMPFLRSFYEVARYYPGLETDGMTAPKDIDEAAKKWIMKPNPQIRRPPMTMPITLVGSEKERQKMILQALKAKAPKQYQKLEKSQGLERFADQAERALMEDYHLALGQVIMSCRTNPPKGETHLSAIQALEMGAYEAWQETIQNHLEFSDATTE